MSSLDDISLTVCGNCPHTMADHYPSVTSRACTYCRCLAFVGKSKKIKVTESKLEPFARDLVIREFLALINDATNYSKAGAFRPVSIVQRIKALRDGEELK